MAFGKLSGKGHSEWNYRPVILSILLVLISLDLALSQTVFIHWDEVSRGNYEPRLEGFGEPPQRKREAAAASHAPSQQEVPSSSPVEYVTSDVDEDVSPSLQEKNFIDTCSASRLREVVKQLNIRCLACSDKSHFKDAITEFVSSLSIRSLKNMLAERGRMCIRCKTRADLLSSVLQVVHLPAANVTFPVIVSFVTVLFPRGIAEFVTQDVKVIRLLRDLQSSNKKFAVSSGTRVATVAKVLSIQDLSEGTVKAKLKGGQRIKINQTWTDVKSDFTYINGTLFSDEAIKSTRTDEMKELHKQTRRIFFSLDHDAAADARSSSIGNPPAEAEGPEAFLNWLCMALAYNVFWRSQTNPFTMVTRQALLQSTDTVAKMTTVRDILIRHSERLHTHGEAAAHQATSEKKREEGKRSSAPPHAQQNQDGPKMPRRVEELLTALEKRGLPLRGRKDSKSSLVEALRQEMRARGFELNGGGRGGGGGIENLEALLEEALRTMDIAQRLKRQEIKKGRKHSGFKADPRHRMEEEDEEEEDGNPLPRVQEKREKAAVGRQFEPRKKTI